MNKPNIKFVDNKGNPVSWEAFESQGFTENMSIEGQGEIVIKTKSGVLGCGFCARTREDFHNLADVIFNEVQQREKDVKG